MKVTNINGKPIIANGYKNRKHPPIMLKTPAANEAPELIVTSRTTMLVAPRSMNVTASIIEPNSIRI
jgi:hypothetical protein